MTPRVLTVPRYVDTTVVNGDRYMYVITARDFAGNESRPSPRYESRPVHIDLLSGAPDDADRDGLTDREEAALGTDPFSRDTDGDGFSDADEVLVYGSSPLKADSDADGDPEVFVILDYVAWGPLQGRTLGPQFSSQDSEWSLGRFPDGAGNWGRMVPTPGESRFFCPGAPNTDLVPLLNVFDYDPVSPKVGDAIRFMAVLLL